MFKQHEITYTTQGTVARIHHAPNGIRFTNDTGHLIYHYKRETVTAYLIKKGLVEQLALF